VGSDLFDSAPSSDVLGLWQLRSPGGAGKGDEIASDHRYRAPSALLPWRVRGRIDDYLADSSPTGVMRVATRDQKSCERVGYPLGVGIGPVNRQMPQRGADVATVVHCPGQLPRRPSWPVSRIVDPSTLLAPERRVATLSPPSPKTLRRSGCPDEPGCAESRQAQAR
jgi:hypothetical protein